MKTITKIINTISKYLAYIAVAFLVVMMFLVTFDVAVRLITGHGFTGTYEVCQYMLCVIIYGGFAFCQTRHGHIHVHMFLVKMPRQMGNAVWTIVNFVSAAMGVLITVASWIQSITVRTQGIYSALLRIPQYPFQLFAGICMIVFAMVLLLDAVKGFLAFFSEEYSEEIRESWIG